MYGVCLFDVCGECVCGVCLCVWCGLYVVCVVFVGCLRVLWCVLCVFGVCVFLYGGCV